MNGWNDDTGVGPDPSSKNDELVESSFGRKFPFLLSVKADVIAFLIMLVAPAFFLVRGIGTAKSLGLMALVGLALAFIKLLVRRRYIEKARAVGKELNVAESNLRPAIREFCSAITMC